MQGQQVNRRKHHMQSQQQTEVFVQESTDGSICTRVNDRRKVIIHKSKGQRQTEGDYTQVKGQ